MVEKFKKPKIKDYVYIFKIGKYEYQVRIGENDFVYRLKGKSALYLSKILPLLNGRYTINQIAKKTNLRKPIVEEVIEKIETFLINGDIIPEERYKKVKNQLQFFSLWNKNPCKMQRCLAEAIVCIINSGSLASEMINALVSSGFNSIYVISDPTHFRKRKIASVRLGNNGFKLSNHTYVGNTKLFDDIDLFILCQDSFDPHFCNEVNSFAISQEKPYMFIRKNGITNAIIGPLVVPNLTPCYKCLELRVQSNLDFFSEYMVMYNYLKRIRKKKVTACLNVLDKLLSSLTTIELIKYFTGYESPVTYGRFLVVDQISFRFELHDVLKLPRCPVCGVKEKSFNLPWMEPIRREPNES